MKYKLIKSYPGSPRLGTEVIFSETHQIYNFNGGDFYSELPKNQVENLPEFWEKVEEKTYQILKFNCVNSDKSLSDQSFEIQENGLYYWGASGYTLQQLLDRPFRGPFIGGFVIESVKRLSDGEVFTVGEEVDDWGTKRVITGFSNETGWVTIPVVFDSYGKTDLTGIKKVKKPLFTTEDGVEKFEGDLFVPVNVSVDDADNYTIRGLNSEAKPYNTKIQEEARKNGVLWFSTKEAAEEYILMNKPCLSVKEVVDILANYALTIQSRGKIYHTLVEKATQRNDSK